MKRILEQEIAKEQSCIEDLLVRITIHIKRGDYQLASERGNDMQKSIKKIEHLKQQQENNRNFASIIERLAAKGILVEAVKRVEN